MTKLKRITQYKGTERGTTRTPLDPRCRCIAIRDII